MDLVARAHTSVHIVKIFALYCAHTMTNYEHCKIQTQTQV